MNPKHLLLLLLVIPALGLTSCHPVHPPCTTNCGGGGGGTGTGNSAVSITLYDAPPSGVNILSFTLPIGGISLTPTSGNPVVLTTAVSSVEVRRLQTDSALLVDAFPVAPGSYKGLQVTVGPTSSTSNIFINTSGSAITFSGGSCTPTSTDAYPVCPLPSGTLFTINIPFTTTLTLSANQHQWIGLNLNLNNAIVTSGGQLTVDFTPSNVLTATTTLRTGLSSGAVDTIEDFVGVVTAYTSGSSITVQNGVSGQKITATLNGSTEYDNTLPSGNSYSNCGTKTAQTCLAVGSTISMNATLDSSGTLTATEVDVLDATTVDEVEGVLYPAASGSACPAGSCFGLILADKASATTGGSATLTAASTTWGTGIFLNVAGVSSSGALAIDTNTLSPFLTSIASGFSTTSDLLAGQQVRVQVSSVTSTNGDITAQGNKILLRFSRLTGTPSNVGASGFDFAPPSYLSALEPQLFTPMVADTAPQTLYDGATTNADFANSPAISLRTLFFNAANPTFVAAKVRVP